MVESRLSMEKEARVKWTPVSGEVSNSFRDLEVSATKVLPIDLLEVLYPPWEFWLRLSPFQIQNIFWDLSLESILLHFKMDLIEQRERWR